MRRGSRASSTPSCWQQTIATVSIHPSCCRVSRSEGVWVRAAPQPRSGPPRWPSPAHRERSSMTRPFFDHGRRHAASREYPLLLRWGRFWQKTVLMDGPCPGSLLDVDRCLRLPRKAVNLAEPSSQPRPMFFVLAKGFHRPRFLTSGVILRPCPEWLSAHMVDIEKSPVWSSHTTKIFWLDRQVSRLCHGSSRFHDEVQQCGVLLGRGTGSQPMDRKRRSSAGWWTRRMDAWQGQKPWGRIHRRCVVAVSGAVNRKADASALRLVLECGGAVWLRRLEILSAGADQ